MPTTEVAIIGAGVIGLQTALFLQEAGYSVTLIAKHSPGDHSIEYTSPWAGADWRTHVDSPDNEVGQWDIETFNYWKELVDGEKDVDEAKKSGVGRFHLRYYWDAPCRETSGGASGFWWRGVAPDLKEIDKTNLPAGVDFAIEFTTFCLNPDKYLAYLKNRVELGGGRFVSYELPTTGGFSKALSSAAGKIGKAPDIWVNASGLGARLLVGDDNLYPTRGQTVLVKGNPNGATTRLGVDYITYIIPRPGGTVILGGCKQDENWNQDVDKELSAAIQNRCKKFAPELLNKDGEFDIISEQVGFRPSRRGGPRVEAELVEGNSKEKPYLVVHCYGNSGSGYQSSIGCTRKAVRLVEEYINENLRSR